MPDGIDEIFTIRLPVRRVNAELRMCGPLHERSACDAAQVGSCAAQNAALVLLLLSSQVVGVQTLARGALAYTGSATIGFD
jgi:hypothetical protein